MLPTPRPGGREPWVWSYGRLQPYRPPFEPRDDGVLPDRPRAVTYRRTTTVTEEVTYHYDEH